MAETRGNYRATVTLLLEDVTPDVADEFWERLAGKDIAVALGGVTYVAEVVGVDDDTDHEAYRDALIEEDIREGRI